VGQGEGKDDKGSCGTGTLAGACFLQEGHFGTGRSACTTKTLHSFLFAMIFEDKKRSRGRLRSKVFFVTNSNLRPAESRAEREKILAYSNPRPSNLIFTVPSSDLCNAPV